jgi:hypothetical protein
VKQNGVVIAESKITRGVDATAALNAVANGDADAGIVYATDALSAKKLVRAIAIPGSTNVRASYGIGIIRASKHGAIAEKFVAFVLSSQGKRILFSGSVNDNCWIAYPTFCASGRCLGCCIPCSTGCGFVATGFMVNAVGPVDTVVKP